MECHKLIMDGYDRILQALEHALSGLTEDDLNEQPHPDCYSIGWLAWHLTRLQDDYIADLMGEDQLWAKDMWYTKFNRAPDLEDIGLSHTAEDIAAFRSVNVDTLLEYHRAVLHRTKQYIATLSMDDLARELNEPWFHTPPTVAVRLMTVMSDSLQHVGQIAYVRDLLKGKGWSETSKSMC